ncbi:MAG: hypothetical protein INR73_10110 [Williamsia sp.]|nr:hypothetical protein [Williamsia sp.]
MKQTNSRMSIPLLLVMMISLFVLNSCSAIEGIFKAGAWTGIILVVVVIAIVIWIISRLGGRS